MAILKARTRSQQQIYLLLIWKTTVSTHSNIIFKQSQLASLCFRADTNYAFSFSSLHGGYGKAEGWVGLSVKLAHQQPLPQGTHRGSSAWKVLAWYVYSYSPSPSSVPPLVTRDSYNEVKLKVTASFPFLLRVQLTLICFHAPHWLNMYHGKIWNDTQSACVWAPTRCHKWEGNPIHDLRWHQSVGTRCGQL